MIYFRRWWGFPAFVGIVMYVSCKYLVVVGANGVINFLNEMGPKVKLDVLGLTKEIQEVKTSSESLSNQVLICLGMLTLIVVLWMIVDLLTGQLVRDFKSANLTKYLTREVVQDSVGVVMEEEKKANKWIRHGRITKRQGKMVFRIWIMSNSTVLGIIKERCEQELPTYLPQAFKGSNWTPVEIKKGGVIKCLTVKQK